MLAPRLPSQNCQMSSIVAPDPKPEASVRSVRARSVGECAIKRIIDVLGASIALLVFSPILLATSLLIKLADGGPIIYRRRVIGQKGEFDAFKLRTMRVDADRVLEDNPELLAEYKRNYKLRNDPRITRVGAILRKYSLDELPQLFNVLFGHMSLVGPRMVTGAELQKYGDCGHSLRTVKPGLTGYWQVNGRQQTSYAERVAMDTYYIENWSLFFDLQILLQTPIEVLKGEGAY